MDTPDLLTHAARRQPDRICVEAEDRAFTFADVDERAARLASVFRDNGVVDGARVALLAYNEPEFTEIRVAAQRAGAILVPLNYRLTATELSATLADCTPRLLIVGPGLEATADRLDVPVVLRLAGAAGTDGCYEDALAAATPIDRLAGISAERPAMIGYTSGTTGRPKGVVLSNGALHAGMIAMGQEIGARPDAVYLTVMPMFHIGSLVGYSFTYLGATCVLRRRFDPGEVVRLLCSGRITHTQLVPAMVRTVLDGWPGDRTTLERVLYGGAPMPPDLAQRALRTLGCGLVNGYGSTEGMGIAMLSPEEHDPDGRPHLLASVGRSGIGMTARVVDDTGADVRPGEVGEIVCRGPSLMTEYWRNPEATAHSLRDGWFHTGDLGRRDAEGYLYLVDRKNDKIVTGGENVYPTEVENVLLTHPAVGDVAVVGLHDETWGEAVSAAVVLEPGTHPEPEELIAHCRERLAGYKVPKRLRFVDALPKTPTGKLLRRQIRTAWRS